MKFLASCIVALILAGAQPARAGEIVVGMSAAFTGSSRGLSIELYRGSLAYLQHINAAGGVHGNTIRIKAYDDGYDPATALDNTMRLVEKDKVFLLFDYMGTPTVTRVLPLLKKFEDRSIYLFFPFTGAEPQRRYPYDRYVFNLRASYHEETAKLVDQLVSVGRKRIAVFYQIDAYGRSGWDGVRRRLDKHGLQIVAEATYPRNALYRASFAPQVELLRKAKPDAVIAIATYSAAAAFIRDARDAGWSDIPIANISGVDSDNLLRLLIDQGEESNKDYTANLINSQVVPSYHDTSLRAVQDYRQAMDKYKPQPPAELLNAKYPSPAYSFNSLEGYLNARLLVEVLKKMGPNPRREQIPAAVEAIRDLNLDIDAAVSFAPDRHQGLNRVYCTIIRNGQFVSLADDDWQQWQR